MTIGGAWIYYTGYGEESTGNWCFRDGTINFQDIFALYNKYLKEKLLYIISDCSYSGQWVVECAKCLDEMRIGACGHQTREQGIMIKVYASCQPHQKATSGCYVKQEGIYPNKGWKSTSIDPNKKLSETQTSYGCDFTRTKCLQLEGPTSPCLLPDIPAQCSWKWQDVVAIDNPPSSLIYLVKGTDEGRKAWYYVLVKEALEEKFEAQLDTVADFAEFGYVIETGLGKEPPDDIKEAVGKYGPSYYFKPY